MDQLKEKNRWLIYKRIVISAICFLTPVFVLSAIFILNNRQTIWDEITSTTYSQLSIYQNRLDTEVARINANLLASLSNKEIGVLSVFPNFLNNLENLEYLIYAQREMRYLANSSPYILDAYVMIPQINRTIAFNKTKLFDQNEFDELKKLMEERKHPIIYYNRKLLLVSSYPISITSDQDALFLIVVELSQQYLKNELNAMKDATEHSQLLFYNSDLTFQMSTDTVNQDFYMYDKDNTMRRIKEEDGYYFAVYAYSPAFNATLCKIVPESLLFESIAIQQLLILGIYFIAILTVLNYMYYLYKLIHKPLNILTNSFAKMVDGATDVSISYDFKDEFGYIYKHFNKMTTRLDTLIQQVYIQRILMQKAQLKQLQSQINPHFLYNSFFILGTLSRIGDYETLEKFSDQLGEYFQFITKNNSDEISLSEEVRHARTYTEIQAQRFKDRIEIQFGDIPKGFEERSVPRLILQPIIENSFIHGIERMSKGGWLRVTFIAESDNLTIIVDDNGNCPSDERLEQINKMFESKDNELETTGIINIHHRLVLKFGVGSGINIKRNIYGGVCVTAKIFFGGCNCDKNVNM